MKKRKTAVASNFSPRFLAVLGEAARFSAMMNGYLHIIHAAAHTDEKEQRFREGIAAVGLPVDTPVFWFDSLNPSDAILSFVEQEKIDMLISGALERDSGHRNFTGNIARELLLKCQCDLALLPKPQQNPGPISKIAVAVDIIEPDVEWIKTILEIARDTGFPLLNFFSILTPFDKIREGLPSDSSSAIEAQLESLVIEAGDYEGECDCRIIRSNTGFNACEIIQGLEPDLLLAKRCMGKSDLLLPRHMDWLNQVIPSNVMIFRG